jgi:hypothetical protein
MFVRKILKIGFTFILSVSSSFPLWAKDTPADFGKNEWAVNNWNEAVRYLYHFTDRHMQNRLLSIPEDRKELKSEAWHDL